MTYTVRDIETAVCARFKLTKAELRSPARIRKISRPRQIAMFLARELTPASYPQIGRVLGGREHTTIMHGRKRIAALMRESNEIPSDVQDVRDILFSGPTYRQRLAAAIEEGMVRA